ncbi:HMA2 domain-containing protein [Brasilonema sp. UFV-L1]|uniref:HMA2 domain-containing protein n=1 Tax=Brasilonema sp. UFV-L1 TaxID=2234130 RepID=UPI00145D8929|nr:hypothetical protein [Brasilonema sp. UFV-L1]NMG07265.1 hypothetical protein [Brasilonema sp. UFV-L1]
MAGLTMQLALDSNEKSQVVEQQTSHLTLKSHPAVVYSMTYALSGTVGFCIPQISIDPTYTQRLLTLLASEPKVITQQVNDIAGSIVITYESGIMSDGEMRLYLARLIQSASNEVTKAAPQKAMQLALDSNGKSQVVEQQNSHSIAKPHSTVVYSITYATSGRVGFCVPQISIDPTYVQRLLTLLACDPQVITQQINEIAGSVVIDYKPGIMSDSEMRLYLACLIQSASNEVTIPEPENVVSSSSVSQTATRPSVAQEKENGEQPVEANVLFEPELVGIKTSLDSKLEWTGICCAPKLVSEGVSPEPKFEEACKIPTPQNQSNHSPQKISPRAKQPAKVAYSIAHAIPGRIRFRIPRIAKDSKYVQRLKALLKADPLVSGDRINTNAASIVITYNSGTIPNSKKRSLSLLEQVTSYLSSLIQSAASDAVVSIS